MDGKELIQVLVLPENDRKSYLVSLPKSDMFNLTFIEILMADTMKTYQYFGEFEILND